MLRKIALAATKICVLIILLGSCKNRTSMSEFYSSSSLPNVHWRYYIYDEALFYETLNELKDIKTKQD